MKHPTVLIFVEFPDPEFSTLGFLDHLAYPNAELVGFYHTNDDDSVEDVRSQYEEEFTRELQEQAERLEQQGVRTEYSLVFDHDRVKARQRVAQSDGVDAILTPGGTNTIGNILIPSSHTQNQEEKISTLLNTVDRDKLISIDLLHIADPENPEGEAEGREILDEISSILTDEDIPSVRINQEVRTGEDVSFEIEQAAHNYDLVVLGETEQDIGAQIFGPVGDHISDNQDIPVLIIR